MQILVLCFIMVCRRPATAFRAGIDHFPLEYVLQSMMAARLAVLCSLVISLASAVEHPAVPRKAFVSFEAKGAAYEPVVEVRARQPLLRQAVFYERASDESDETHAFVDEPQQEHAVESTDSQETAAAASEMERKKAAWLAALQSRASQAEPAPPNSHKAWLNAITAAAKREHDLNGEETPEEQAESMKELKDIAVQEAREANQAKIPKVTVLSAEKGMGPNSENAASEEYGNILSAARNDKPKRAVMLQKHTKITNAHLDDGSYLGGASLLDQEHIIVNKKHNDQRIKQIPSAVDIRALIASPSYTIPAFDPKLYGPPGAPGQSPAGPDGPPGPAGPDGDDESSDDIIAFMAAICMIVGNLAMALCLASVLKNQIQARKDGGSSYAKAGMIPGASSGAGSISMSLTIIGLDFAKIEANPEANSAFELAIRNAIAAECGDGSTGDNVAVAFAAGEPLQVLVSASIVPVSEASKINAVLSQSGTLGSQLSAQLDVSVKLIVPDAIQGSITVTDVVTTLATD